MKTYFHQLGDNAQAYYRAVLPARHLPKAVCSPELTTLEYDCFVLPRLISPGFVPTLLQIKKLKKRIVLDLDDDLWHIPESNPAFKTYTPEALIRLNWTAEVADYVTVSTENLKKVVLEQTGRDAVVLPNLVDLDDWMEATEPKEATQPIRVLWAGSQYHADDLEGIVEPIKQLLSEYRGRMQALFFGFWPKGLCRLSPIPFTYLTRQVPNTAGVGFIDPVALSQYPKAMVTIRPDIGLVPLADTTFNQSKSNIKFLEYSMAGASSVAGDWYEEIKKLLDSPEVAKHKAVFSKQLVISEHSWQQASKPWVDFYGGIS